MEGRVINYSDIVHNFCVQIWVGRVGGEGNLVNDNKYQFFFLRLPLTSSRFQETLGVEASVELDLNLRAC